MCASGGSSPSFFSAGVSAAAGEGDSDRSSSAVQSSSSPSWSPRVVPPLIRRRWYPAGGHHDSTAAIVFSGDASPNEEEEEEEKKKVRQVAWCNSTVLTNLRFRRLRTFSIGVSILLVHVFLRQVSQQSRWLTVVRENNQSVSPDKLVFDLVSIGSNRRLEYLDAQKSTFGAHRAVRHFLAITEDDDYERECSTELTARDASQIVDFCLDKQRIEALSQKHPILADRRRAFGNKHHESAGWFCAQKRANDGLQKALRLYWHSTSLPDYLMILDDDTFINIDAVYDFLGDAYNSTDANIIAGCLMLRGKLLFPWGGWGTLLSKGALQNLVQPLDCTLRQSNQFVEGACKRIEEDSFGEQRHFRNGMSIGELINAYVTAEKFTDYQKWTDRGFCLHSDWVWGYFFNYYDISSTGDPYFTNVRHVKENRMQSYLGPESEIPTLRGQCIFNSDQACAAESHICHYVTPEGMHRLNKENRNKIKNENLLRSKSEEKK